MTSLIQSDNQVGYNKLSLFENKQYYLIYRINCNELFSESQALHFCQFTVITKQ